VPGRGTFKLGERVTLGGGDVNAANPGALNQAVAAKCGWDGAVFHTGALSTPGL
jgi:hypothetical protein